MKEKTIVAAIEKYLKALPRCFFFKEHGGPFGTAGVPDLICCIDGRFFAFEVKTAEGRLSKLQEKTIEKILRAGGAALVVRSAEEAKAAVQKRGAAIGKA
jgi:hypothetical protein